MARPIVCLALYGLGCWPNQVLNRERISRFKRELDKMRGVWLSAVRAALGSNCPDQLHLTLHPHLQPISPGAHLKSNLKVHSWIELVYVYLFLVLFLTYCLDFLG